MQDLVARLMLVWRKKLDSNQHISTVRAFKEVDLSIIICCGISCLWYLVVVTIAQYSLDKCILALAHPVFDKVRFWVCWTLWLGCLNIAFYTKTENLGSFHKSIYAVFKVKVYFAHKRTLLSQNPHKHNKIWLLPGRLMCPLPWRQAKHLALFLCIKPHFGPLLHIN